MNCSFKYPSEKVLNLKRALVPDDFKLMLPTKVATNVRREYERPSTPSYARAGLSSIPARIANAILSEVPVDRLHPFPFKNLRLFEYQYMFLIGRLAAEGIEPHLAALTPAWQPGADKVDARTYQVIRDAVLQDENRYAELASRHLVRAHTRALALGMADAMKDHEEAGETRGYAYNKAMADALKEYLPELCTAWRYAELVVAADGREETRGVPVGIDWKELQKTYGPLRLS